MLEPNPELQDWGGGGGGGGGGSTFYLGVSCGLSGGHGLGCRSSGVRVRGLGLQA